MSDLSEGFTVILTDHCLVVAKLIERLSVSKQVAQKSDMQRFDLKKQNNAEVKKQYQVKISNSFAVSENMDVDIKGLGKILRENIKISAKESPDHYNLKQHKPWIVKECSKLLDRRSGINCNGCRIHAK
jgi:hypothetical protein